MTNFVQAAAAIRTRLQDNRAAFGGLPVTHGNDGFEPETHGGDLGWVFCRIATLGGRQTSLGDVGQRTFRSEAQAHIWVYVPRGSKIGGVEAHASAICDLFKPEAFSVFNFTNRYIGEGGPDGRDGRWYGIPVILAFSFDETI